MHSGEHNPGVRLTCPVISFLWLGSILNIHWKDWCWGWSASILVICGEQTAHWKSPWCWERLRTGEEGITGRDSWMVSPMQRINSGRWWGPGRPDGEGNGILVGCSPWGRRESDTTEQFHFHSSLSGIGEGHDNPLLYSCLKNPREKPSGLPATGSHRIGSTEVT